MSRRGESTAKHLAETLAGLLWLDAGDVDRALAHLTESLNVANETDLITGSSWELVVALEAKGVTAPEVVRARQTLVGLRLGRR